MTREELIFNLKYGDDLASLQFKSLPATEQAELIARARSLTIDQAEKLLNAIESKDVRRLELTLHTGNKTSRAIFHRATGVKLPSTERATREAIRQFVGEEHYDSYKAERAAEQDREAAEREAKNLKAERDAALDKRIRYHTGGPGTQVVGTYREWIEHLARTAVRTEPAKRGFRDTLKVIDGEGCYCMLETKHEIAYFREVRSSKESPCPTNP